MGKIDTEMIMDSREENVNINTEMMLFLSDTSNEFALKSKKLEVDVEEKLPNYLVGVSLNRYNLLHCINRGGTSRIWSATDPSGKVCYVKIYSDKLALNVLKEYYNEFVGKKINGIVTVLDYGMLQIGKSDYLFCVMPSYQDFVSLREYLRNNTFTENEMLAFIDASNEALHQLHCAGYFHNDIKPDNFLYNKNKKEIILIDLGSISKEYVEQEEMATTTSNIMLTQGYTAPEVVQYYGVSFGHKIVRNDKSDYFSLGVVLAEIFKIEEMKKRNKITGSEIDTRIFSDNMEMITELKGDSAMDFLDAFVSGRKYQDLIKKLLKYDTNSRAGYQEVKKWIEEYKQYQSRYTWKGKVYEYKDGKETLYWVLKDLWNDAESNGTKFDELFGCSLLDRLLGLSENSKELLLRKKQINEMSEQSMSLAKYAVIELLSPNYLIKMITDYKYNSFLSYFEMIFTTKNIDQALIGDALDEDVITFCKSYSENDKLRAILSVYYPEAKFEKINMQENNLELVINVMQELCKAEQIEKYLIPIMKQSEFL